MAGSALGLDAAAIWERRIVERVSTGLLRTKVYRGPLDATFCGRRSRRRVGWLGLFSALTSVTDVTSYRCCLGRDGFDGRLELLRGRPDRSEHVVEIRELRPLDHALLVEGPHTSVGQSGVGALERDPGQGSGTVERQALRLWRSMRRNGRSQVHR